MYQPGVVHYQPPPVGAIPQHPQQINRMNYGHQRPPINQQVHPQQIPPAGFIPHP